MSPALAILLWRAGLPIPVCQFEMVDEYGGTVARMDFAWPEHGVFLEFDGKVKYDEATGRRVNLFWTSYSARRSVRR